MSAEIISRAAVSHHRGFDPFRNHWSVIPSSALCTISLRAYKQDDPNPPVSPRAVSGPLPVKRGRDDSATIREASDDDDANDIQILASDQSSSEDEGEDANIAKLSKLIEVSKLPGIKGGWRPHIQEMKQAAEAKKKEKERRRTERRETIAKHSKKRHKTTQVDLTLLESDDDEGIVAGPSSAGVVKEEDELDG